MEPYIFSDTQPRKQASAGYPAEAMSFDGVYLEDVILGYRTLSVSGREATEVEFTEEERKTEDGNIYISKRYLPRTIRVTSQVLAQSNEQFREIFNKLNQILDKPQSKIIFQDEPDKYFIGTRSKITGVDEGLNSVTMQIEIYCADPFKYAVNPKTVLAQKGNFGLYSAVIENTGAVPAVLDYKIQFPKGQEDGYIGISSASGAMEFGIKDEKDGRSYFRDENIASIADLCQAADDSKGSEMPIYAYTEVAYPFKLYADSVSDETSCHNGGTFLNLAKKESNLAINDEKGETLNMTLGNYKVEIAEKTVAVKADSNGKVGTVSCYLDVLADFRIGSAQETGFLWVGLLGEDHKAIAGAFVSKSDAGGKNARIRFSTYNSQVMPFEPDPFNCSDDDGNPMYGPKKGYGHIAISFDQGNLKFLFNGKWYNVSDPDDADKEVHYVQAACGQYCNAGTETDHLVSHLGFYKVDLIKKTYKYENVKNQFSDGAEVFINGNQGKIYIDGVYSPGKELLGTEYFKVPAGSSEVDLAFSSWVEKEPEIEITVHERWL